MTVCNKDCFCCPYPDCICDELDHEDYKELARIERTEIFPRSQAQKKVAASKKAWYEANREKVAASQKAYREANREKVAASKKAYREANREKVAASKKAALKIARLSHGYTQVALARLVGVSQATISQYETGCLPYDPHIFASILPELMEVWQ